MNTAKELPLNPLWDAQGASFAKQGTWKVPSVFTDAFEEYEASRKKAGLLDLSYRGKVKVTGGDRIDFLHRLLTNDIRSLKPGGGCYAALLTAQGRVIADMRVYLFEEFILLDLEMDLEQKAIGSLDRFIITEDVGLEDVTEQYVHLKLQGKEAGNILSKIMRAGEMPGKDHQTSGTGWSGATVIRREQNGQTWFELLAEISEGKMLAEEIMRAGFEAGLALTGYETGEILRIEGGILRYGFDITEEIALPETGLDRIAASETKGCYPGQEVVARMNTYQGHTKKITGFVLEGKTVPSNGDKVMLEGKEIGRITSACFSPAFNKPAAVGYLIKGYFDSGLHIMVAGKAGKTPGTTRALPLLPEA